MFKVLLVYPNIRHESLVPPSVALLSRILKNEGFQVELFDSTDYEIDLNAIDSDRERRNNLTVIPYASIERFSKGGVFGGFCDMVSSFSPDLIAVTSTESTFLMATSFISALGRNRPPVVLGGVFATFAPELVLRYDEIDMCVVGEGERTLVELCRCMERGEDVTVVQGLWAKLPDGTVRKNLPAVPVDVNTNPTDLDVGLFDSQRLYRPMAGTMFRMLSVETHRGCPYTCAFCNSPSQNEMFGTKGFFRKKSPEKVREEILYYRDVFDVNYVFFWADTFFAYSPREFDAFIEMYRDIGLPFWCQTRPETIIAQKGRLEQLREIGLHFISFGLEHGNERFRAEVVNRKMTNQLLYDAFQATREAGMPFNVNNIIGFPGETRDLVFDTIDLNRRIGAASMSCSIFMPYHGTALHRLSVERGYIAPDTICPSNNDAAIMNMSSMSREEIMGLARTFVLYVRFPKERWPEIAMAEKDTPEGREKLEELRAEYRARFLSGTVPVPLYKS